MKKIKIWGIKNDKMILKKVWTERETAKLIDEFEIENSLFFEVEYTEDFLKFAKINIFSQCFWSYRDDVLHVWDIAYILDRKGVKND